MSSIKKSPNSAENWLKLGNLESESGDFSNGIKHYKKAIKIDPELKIAYFYIGNIYIEQKKYRKAIEALEKILNKEIDADICDIFYSLGICHMELKEYKAAKNYFQKILKLDSNDNFSKEKLKEIDKIE
jgi:tetratricopeptide (TPR) repeat protein